MLIWAFTGLLVLVRLMAVTTTAPIFGSRHIGLWPRLVIAAGLTVVVLPIIPPAAVSPNPIELGQACISEALTGAMLGFGMTILFTSATAAGGLIGQLAGLQLFGNVDPHSGSSESATGQLFRIVSIAVFALLGGLELILAGVLDSLATLPIGTTISSENWIWLLTGLLQQSFLLILRCVAPSVAAMFIATYLIGMLNRTFPSMNAMGIGLSSNLVIMLLAVFLTLGGTMWLLVDDMHHATTWLNNTFRQLVTH